MAFEDRTNRLQLSVNPGTPAVFTLPPGAKILRGCVILVGNVVIFRRDTKWHGHRRRRTYRPHPSHSRHMQSSSGPAPPRRANWVDLCSTIAFALCDHGAQRQIHR